MEKYIFIVIELFAKVNFNEVIAAKMAGGVVKKRFFRKIVI